MINGVRTCHNRQQHLSSANIGSRFFAADVLFAGLQGHSQRPIALGVNRNADDAARNLTFEGIFGGKKSSVWATKTHRHAKTLRRPYHHICAHFARRSEQSEAQ